MFNSVGKSVIIQDIVMTSLIQFFIIMYIRYWWVRKENRQLSGGS